MQSPQYRVAGLLEEASWDDTTTQRVEEIRLELITAVRQEKQEWESTSPEQSKVLYADWLFRQLVEQGLRRLLPSQIFLILVYSGDAYAEIEKRFL